MEVDYYWSIEGEAKLSNLRQYFIGNYVKLYIAFLWGYKRIPETFFRLRKH